MATIGQQLLAPETGWRRYDDTNNILKYQNATWKTYGTESCYGGSYKYVDTGSPINTTILTFKFYGTKLRVIGLVAGAYTSSAKVKIDGVDSGTFSQKNTPVIFQTLNYDIENLSLGEHIVEIINLTTDAIGIDAIDIDESGYLLAQVGGQLSSPEPNWQRIDDVQLNLRIRRYGTGWNLGIANADCYNSTFTYASTQSTEVSFKFRFKGTKIRYIGVLNIDYSANNKIKIDGVEYPLSLYHNSTTQIPQVLNFELLNLPDSVHTVEVISAVGPLYFGYDAVDIDENGYLLHPFLNEKKSFAELQIGDYIECDYYASGGHLGYFSNFGASTKNEILTPATTANGKARFIMVGYDNFGRKKLISDRVLQIELPWDRINSAGYFSQREITGKKEMISVTNHSNTYSEGQIVYSNNNPTYSQPYMVFDDTFNAMWTSGVISNTEYIGFVFNEPTKIDSITFDSVNFDQYMKTVQIQVTEDGANWTTIKTAPNLLPGSYEVFLDGSLHKGYRLYISEYNAAQWTGMGKIRFFQNTTPNSKIFIGGLTGGISNTDKDNEYDKILLEYDLEGKIQLTDSTYVWNLGRNEWTTTTYRTSGMNYRTIRNGSTFTYDVSSNLAGWRPVLYVENLFEEKFLVLKDGLYYGKNDYSSADALTKQIFTSYAMLKNEVPTMLTAKNILPPFKLVRFTIVNEDILNVKLFKDYVELKSIKELKMLHLRELNNISCIGNNARFAFSKDNINWKSYQGGSWQTVDIANANKDSLFSTMNTLAETNSFTDVIFKETLNEDLEFYLFIMLGKEGELDSIQMNIDMNGYFKITSCAIDVDEENEKVNITFPQNGNYRVKYQKLTI